MEEDGVTPRIAVVGSGYWGKNLVRNFHEIGALAAICDSNPQRLTSMQADFGSDFATFTDYEDLLADPSIHAIVLATPAVMHEQMTMDALLAGKDVMVEKPLAVTVEGGASLVDLATEHERILMVGHLLWYHPAVLKLKEMVEAGELGKIRYIYSNRLNFGKFRTEENILWSFAPHDVSVILGLLGEMPDRISADGGSFLNANIADVTVTTLGFPGGARAHVFVSWLHPFKEQRLVVIGDRMMAAFEDGPHGGRLNLYRHTVEWDGDLPSPHKQEAEVVELPNGEPLRAECEHFLECVITRQTPRTDGAEGLRVLQVLAECQRSLADR